MDFAPETRRRCIDDRPVRGDGRYILYWMTASRRPGWNFALQHAAALAAELEKPLLVLEAIRCDYRWASDRIHAFVLQGMHEHVAHFSERPVRYYTYVEPRKGAGQGLLRALCQEAAALVADDAPVFFLRGQLERAARQCEVRMEAIDSNGLLPLSATDRVFTVAHSFRRFLQKELPPHLVDLPAADPLPAMLPTAPSIPRKILDRWPEAPAALLRAERRALAELPIDHDVEPVPIEGGFRAGQRRLKHFVHDQLDRYAGERNQPEADATSGLSPYLHFGHVGAHQVFEALVEREGWDLGRIARVAHGKRTGWWGMSESAEAFLDELVTWRELGFNRCWLTVDHDRYESLPEWALETLARHEKDRRPHLYSYEELEHGQTHDPLWNAAQRQLLAEGRIHGYLRMLWGKKILEWTRTPRQALDIAIELNDKYAIDGRDPNSYSGILWVFGRYDRAWGPERSIFGKVRYMSSENTARKVRVSHYIERWAPESS